MHPDTERAHLDALEAEAIWVMREAFAAFRNPMILFSAGKDSCVLAHLAMKAVSPTKLSVPLLHIDTTWKFREMTELRDALAKTHDLEMIVHTNPAGLDGSITPFTHSTDEYTRLMKTVALRQALDAHAVDVAIGGARRDEERSRAKERIFSLRDPGHAWNPRSQRPEFWTTVNPHLQEGQTMRAFPLSNWTEVDIWRYVRREKIVVSDLYFTRSRPTIERDGKLIVLDDARFPLNPNDNVVPRRVRFRTLGCYPLSAAEESEAQCVNDIIRDIELTSTSERSGRLIDGVGASSMEAKKLEGYF